MSSNSVIYCAAGFGYSLDYETHLGFNLLFFHLLFILTLIKYNNTKQKVTKEITKIRLKLDTEKKIMKSRIKEKKKRRESLNVNILKKYNKVLYKPNKKLGITIYNITFGKKDQKEKKMNNKEINNANAMDILTY